MSDKNEDLLNLRIRSEILASLDTSIEQLEHFTLFAEISQNPEKASVLICKAATIRYKPLFHLYERLDDFETAMKECEDRVSGTKSLFDKDSDS